MANINKIKKEQRAKRYRKAKKTVIAVLKLTARALLLAVIAYIFTVLILLV